MALGIVALGQATSPGLIAVKGGALAKRMAPTSLQSANGSERIAVHQRHRTRSFCIAALLKRSPATQDVCWCDERPYGSAHRTNQRQQFLQCNSGIPRVPRPVFIAQCNPSSTGRNLPLGVALFLQYATRQRRLYDQVLVHRRDGRWPYVGSSRQRQCNTAIAAGTRGRDGHRQGPRLSPQLPVRPPPPARWRSRFVRVPLSRFRPQHLPQPGPRSSPPSPSTPRSS